ncbi:MAG: hypothetical protein IPH57_01485 [Saprospiraceae bacterium]|nr:hypothetical protein [Saprospiraceae bacterium]
MTLDIDDEDIRRHYINIKEIKTKSYKNEISCDENEKAQNYQNIKKYYNYINNAELKIIKEELEQALILYKKAFKANKFPFPKDVYNALIVCINIGNIETAFEYSKLLIKYGIDISFFEQTTLKELKKYQSEWNLLVSETPKFKEYHEKYFDKDIISELLLITNSYNYKRFNIESISEIIDVSIDSIYARLFNLIENPAYSGHQIVGAMTFNDTIIINTPYYILANYYSEHEIDDKVLCNLYKQVKKGYMHPKDFLQIFNFSKKIENDYWFSPVMISSENEIYILNKSNPLVKQRIHEYDVFRKKIFCYKYQDEIQKMIFKLKNPTSKINFSNIYLPNKINNILPYQITDTYKKISLDDY